ncbi:MAG: pseudouridine synthase [Saprospiraceae bacterium]|nr:pseudouridine synthase [Saprospiraceae bacterium]
MTILFYKPYQVLSQFTREAAHHQCLADYLNVPKNVYPIGRLDYDSEGLLMLSDDTSLNAQLLSPDQHVAKIYYAQLEGEITTEAIKLLRDGVSITLPNKKKYLTLPSRVKKIGEPNLPERVPPIRVRANIPDSWISIEVKEGKNRQIRKMCAAVGFPVLRLIRVQLGNYQIHGLQPGKFKVID